MQAGHIREQSPTSRVMLTGEDRHPPRPRCDVEGCMKRSDIILKGDKYLCAAHALERMQAGER